MVGSPGAAQPPMFLSNLRKALEMLEPSSIRRWMLNVPLGFLSALVELVTAAAIFAIIAVLNGNSNGADLPVLGWLVRRLPSAAANDRSDVRLLLVVTAALVTIKLVLAVATTIFQQRVIARDRAALATRLYAGYLQAPYSFHLRRSASECVYRIDEAVKIVFETVLGGAASLLHSLLMILALMAVLLWANPWATISVGLCLGAWIYLSLRVSRRALVRLGRQADSHSQERQRVMWEGLSAVREIKIFARERYFRDRFAALQDAMVSYYTRSGLLYALPQVLLEGAFSLGMLVATAIVLASSGMEATLPVLGLYAYVGVRLIPTANIVVVTASRIVTATVPLDLLHRDYQATRAFPPAAVELPPRLPFRDGLTVEAVTFRYEDGSAPALRNVSLSIARGESVALVGRNGAGKSTLMHVLFGLLTPEHGRVLVDGTDIAGAMGSWQQILGYVPQTVHLIEDTLARNVAFGVPAGEIDDDRVREVLRTVRLDDFVAGLPKREETRVGGNGVRLSGGQTQRLAIARTLYHDPEVLLLDEASAALDYKVEREVGETIAALAGHRTLIVIAHRPLTISRCNRVALLREGELVATGTYDEMLAGNQEFRDIIGA